MLTTISALIPKSSSSLMLSLLLFFSVFFPFGSSLSINFPSFNKSTPNLLDLKGDALWNQVIQLTKNDNICGIRQSTGRAVYHQPLRLWDSNTGSLTDFTTHFSFNISALSNLSTCTEFCSGDGLAFFLSPFADIPANSSGGFLGLFRDDLKLDASKNKLVAVEFDTYPNDWDPNSYHVGIDVNSIKSTTTANCGKGIIGGRPSNATISYSSSTKNLSVLLMYNNNETDPHSIGTLSLSYVVDLSKILPSEVVVGFSGATGGSVELHEILSWDFSSTLLAPAPAPAPESRAPVVASPPPKSSTLVEGKANSKIKLLMGLVSGIGAVMIVSGMCWFFLWRKVAMKHASGEENISIDSDELERVRGPGRFSFNELAAATNNFAEEGKLGEGGFGKVYHGLLRGEEVAIKRVSSGSKQGKKEYISEVKIISQLRHRNLVQLVGWCHGKGELLLAYKFMPNGSLDSHLHGEDMFLTWPVRYKIANQLACALLYLHEEWEQCVVHRDVKPSNVMLDSAFNVKLGDFGLARLVDHEIGSQSTTILAGTVGYMAPESFDMGNATKESDVYSFGIVALEIACGRKPIEFGRPKLVELVWELYGKGMVLSAADERLQSDFEEKEMERLMVVGLWCANPCLGLRPSIRQAVSVLNFEATLPDLPPEMPRTASSKGKFQPGQAFADGSNSAANSASYGFTAYSSSLSISSGN